MRSLVAEPSDRGHGAAVGVVDFGGWVAPAMELIYEQGTAAFRGQWPRIEAMLELAPLRPGRGDWPHPSLALPGEATRPARHDPSKYEGCQKADVHYCYPLIFCIMHRSPHTELIDHTLPQGLVGQRATAPIR